MYVSLEIHLTFSAHKNSSLSTHRRPLLFLVNMKNSHSVHTSDNPHAPSSKTYFREQTSRIIKFIQRKNYKFLRWCKALKIIYNQNNTRCLWTETGALFFIPKNVTLSNERIFFIFFLHLIAEISSRHHQTQIDEVLISLFGNFSFSFTIRWWCGVDEEIQLQNIVAHKKMSLMCIKSS